MGEDSGTSFVTESRFKWFVSGIALAVVGIALSLYSINHHMDVKATGETSAACNINEVLSCDDVALSSYSEIQGIPLGVFGLGYFLAILFLVGIGLKGKKGAAEHIHAYAVMVGIGFLTSVALFLISWFVVEKLCINCMGVYLLTILQLVLLIAFFKHLPKGMNFKTLTSGGSTAGIFVVLAIAGYTFLTPMLAGKRVRDRMEEGLPLAQESALKEAMKAQTIVEIPLTKSAYSGLGEDYRKGNDNASVVVMEFADFQCPACREISATLSQLHSEFKDDVLFVFRNFPLDNHCNQFIKSKMHKHACQAASLARCAGQRGKFWQFHDLVFGNQKQINDDNLQKWALAVGMTKEDAEICTKSTDVLNKIREDVKIGEDSGVDSTPTLFINGIKYNGRRDYEGIRAHILRQLRNG